MSAPTETSAGTAAIRPFTVPVTSEAELEALRARVAATRWPDQELVADHSQGPRLAVRQELARWATEYDWRRCEAKLNGLPVIITHRWPGSVIELLAVIDPLTNPTAHGGSAADAFDVVIPSMLYGFCPDTGHN
jgi:hypothetical protein